MKLKAKWTAIILAAYSITSCGYWRSPAIIHSSEETARIYHQYTTDQYVDQYVDKAFDVDSWSALFDDSLTKEKFNFKEYNPYDKELVKTSMDSFTVKSELYTKVYRKHVWINEVPGVQKNKLNELTTVCNDYIYFDSNGVKQRKVNMPHIDHISMQYVSKEEAEQLYNNNPGISDLSWITGLPLLNGVESFISVRFRSAIYMENNTDVPWITSDGKCKVFDDNHFTSGVTDIRFTTINYIITKEKIYQKYFDDYFGAIANDINAKYKEVYDVNELLSHRFVEIDRQDGLDAIKEQFDQSKDLLIRDRTKKIDLDKTDAFVKNVRSKYYDDSLGYYYGVKDEEDYVYGVVRYISNRDPLWKEKNRRQYITGQWIDEVHLLNNNSTSPLLNLYTSEVQLRKV